MDKAWVVFDMPMKVRRGTAFAAVADTVVLGVVPAKTPWLSEVLAVGLFAEEITVPEGWSVCADGV